MPMMSDNNKRAIINMLGMMFPNQPFILLVLGNDPSPEDPHGTRIEVVSNMQDMASVQGVLREASGGKAAYDQPQRFTPRRQKPEEN